MKEENEKKAEIAQFCRRKGTAWKKTKAQLQEILAQMEADNIDCNAVYRQIETLIIDAEKNAAVYWKDYYKNK